MQPPRATLLCEYRCDALDRGSPKCCRMGFDGNGGSADIFPDKYMENLAVLLVPDRYETGDIEFQ